MLSFLTGSYFFLSLFCLWPGVALNSSRPAISVPPVATIDHILSSSKRQLVLVHPKTYDKNPKEGRGREGEGINISTGFEGRHGFFYCDTIHLL